MMKKKLPESILQFVNRQETIPTLPADKTYPCSDYVWKATACILLSGRIKPKSGDGLPNLTDTNRVCREANFGPKKADVPWKEMEDQGWIAQAVCTEIRIPLPDELRMPYALAEARSKFRIASENPLKEKVVRQLLNRHSDEPCLIIAMYVE